MVAERSGNEVAWRIRELLRKLESRTVKYEHKDIEGVPELRYSISSWLIRKLISMLGLESRRVPAGNKQSPQSGSKS